MELFQPRLDERYLFGELLRSDKYHVCWFGSSQESQEIPVFRFDAPDGPVMIWQDAFDLRSFGKHGEEIKVLYHYTNEKGFRNVTNEEQSFGEVWASFGDRAHFGSGVYTTQYEAAVIWLAPSVWEAKYGKDDLQTLENVANLANLFSRQKKGVDAENYFRRVKKGRAELRAFVYQR
eukprot:Skav215809  [mRNA]  locus=scaffold3885:170099:175211:+ [translate_table: standard]